MTRMTDFMESSEKTIKSIETIYMRCTFCFDVLLNEDGRIRFGIKKIGTGRYEQKWCISCESCRKFSKEHAEVIDVDFFTFSYESNKIKNREALKKARETVFKDVSATTWLNFLSNLHFGPCPIV